MSKIGMARRHINTYDWKMDEQARHKYTQTHYARQSAKEYRNN